MARGFRHKHGRYAARLDSTERAVLVGLFLQLLDLLDAEVDAGPRPAKGRRPRSDVDTEFDAIVAGMGPFAPADEPGAAESGTADQPGEQRDPALERLFPVGNREDPEAAAEFRRLTEGSLRARKVTNVRTAIEALDRVPGDKVVLDQQQATALVVTLTDVRLVLGERLGIRTDDDANLLERHLEDAEDDDPAVYAVALYDFLTWLQEGLAQALTPHQPRRSHPVADTEGDDAGDEAGDDALDDGWDDAMEELDDEDGGYESADDEDSRDR